MCSRSDDDLIPPYNRRWAAVHQQYGERREEKPMNDSRHSDPAERSALMRLFYRNWRPTRLGRWVNRFACWWSGLGLPPRFQAALEVHGRTSGRRRANPVVIATVEGKRYLVSMLGPESDWVKNVEAAHMATPLSVRDADAPFTSWQCRRSRGHPSSASTCESLRAADSTSRSPLARRCPTSR
jgi:F420H(2)-dependent quinone reductase